MRRRYVIYQRVSSEEQAKDGYSISAMRDKAEFFIKSQNGELAKIYTDAGCSGRLPPEKRPALNELLQDIKNKTVDFDTVLVWKIDRLSRNLRDTLNLAHIFQRANKSLESVTEKLDTSTASGQMFFSLIASFAEFESAQIGERTWNAMSSKVGEIPLGGKPPLGYKSINNKLQIDQTHAKTIEIIFRKFLTWKKYSSVAQYLNKQGVSTSYNKKWNHTKIRRILINPVYTGSIGWAKRHTKLKKENQREKWIVKKNSHEPIISEKVFNRVRNIIQANM